MSSKIKCEKYNPQFNKLLQIGIIVRKVEESVKRFEKDFGFGP